MFGWRLAWRTFTGARCPARVARGHDRRLRCVEDRGHRGTHGAPVGFDYRRWSGR